MREVTTRQHREHIKAGILASVRSSRLAGGQYLVLGLRLDGDDVLDVGISGREGVFATSSNAS